MQLRIDRDRLSGLEAALKYLIIGGFGSAVLLFGAALVYGATGAIDFPGIAAAGRAHDALLLFGLAMIIAGLAFKASAAPFHMWTPDVYEGAPTPLTAFMAAATKAVALVVMLPCLAMLACTQASAARHCRTSSPIRTAGTSA